MNILEFCGAFLLLYIACVLLIKLLCWVCRFCKPEVLVPQHNDYAVITGASDGIGLEYARQIARKGYNLLLLSRTQEKLAAVSLDIRSSSPQCQNVDYLVVDFSRQDIYEQVKDKLYNLRGNVSVLVNNVGSINSVPKYFTDVTDDFNRKLVNTNVLAMTMMCELVLDKMVKQKKGIVINISSFCGLSEIPLYSAYSASKAYINALSNTLATEYEQHGIIVQLVTPNQVKTKSSELVYDRLVSVDADQFVQAALKAVGRERHTNGHMKHKILNNFTLFAESIVGQDIFMKIKFVMSKILQSKVEVRKFY